MATYVVYINTYLNEQQIVQFINQYKKKNASNEFSFISANEDLLNTLRKKFSAKNIKIKTILHHQKLNQFDKEGLDAILGNMQVITKAEEPSYTTYYFHFYEDIKEHLTILYNFLNMKKLTLPQNIEQIEFYNKLQRVNAITTLTLFNKLTSTNSKKKSSLSKIPFIGSLLAAFKTVSTDSKDDEQPNNKPKPPTSPSF
jgi:DNA replicative helicase MCM subunit Mcm2 (Cdc46/Mcm family)